MVTIQKIEQGIAAYLDSELMPHFTGGGFEKVIAGTAMSLIVRRGGNILNHYKDNKTIRMLGLMDDNGNIDIDILAEEFKKNIPAEGMKVEIPIIGTMTFHKDDVDKLHEYITIL